MNESDGDPRTSTDANLESASSPGTKGKDEGSAFTAPVRIAFYHTRERLADYDNLSGKAALDAIVEAGILTDDSPKEVVEVTHKQRKGKEEGTVIVIRRVESWIKKNETE